MYLNLTVSKLWLVVCFYIFKSCLINKKPLDKTRTRVQKLSAVFSYLTVLMLPMREIPPQHPPLTSHFLLFLLRAGHQRPRLCDREAHQPGGNPRSYLGHRSGSFPRHRELHPRSILHEHAGPDSGLPGQDLHRAGTIQVLTLPVCSWVHEEGFEAATSVWQQWSQKKINLVMTSLGEFSGFWVSDWTWQRGCYPATAAQVWRECGKDYRLSDWGTVSDSGGGGEIRFCCD